MEIPHPQPVNIEGQAFRFVQDRLQGGRVYCSEDGSAYLRIGSPEETLEEELHVRVLGSRGFPVPLVLASGELGQERYFIESSLGEKHFGDIFAEEILAAGDISEKSLAAFQGICATYFAAQCRPENGLHHRDAFEVIALKDLLLVSHEGLNEPKIDAALAKAEELTKDLPNVYLQTDFSPYNVLPAGVIDFEFLKAGPLGYDVISGLHFGHWFPSAEGYDYRRRYSLDQAQRNQFITQLRSIAQTVGVGIADDAIQSFLVVKSMWAAGKSQKTLVDPTWRAKFFEWRRNVMEYCVDSYLENRPIEVEHFDEIV